ncbi:MAG: hypothetical protein ACXWEI_17310 [Mycobacterium sp.]
MELLFERGDRHEDEVVAQMVADGLEALLSGRASEYIVNPEVLTS